MKLYIRIKDGQTFEHPIFEDNFREAFPDVDVDNLPDEFAHFERVAPPTLGVYEVYEGTSYGHVVGKLYADVHHVRQMTNEEITAKQEAVKAEWAAANNGFNSWNFSDALCKYVAPAAYPEDGNQYVWRESDLSWVLVPTPPKGEGWTFNIQTGNWVKV